MNLNCMFHDDKAAVAQCVVCGVGLCKECAEKYEPIVCERCASQVQKNEQKNLRGLFIYVCIAFGLFTVIGVVSFLMAFVTLDFAAGIQGLLGGIFLGWEIAGLPSGWRAVSKIKLDIFLVLPILGWVMLYAFKVLLAAFVGFIAMPIDVVKYIKTVKDNK